jgi:hypothetical protein
MEKGNIAYTGFHCICECSSSLGYGEQCRLIIYQNKDSFIDYKTLYGVDGIELANIVANTYEVEGHGKLKQLKMLITFNDSKQTYFYLSTMLANLCLQEVPGPHSACHQRITKVTELTAIPMTQITAPFTCTLSQSCITLGDDTDNCALHLHSVMIPHNFGCIFPFLAPGFVMGISSIGPTLCPYEESDTFLSTGTV